LKQLRFLLGDHAAPLIDPPLIDPLPEIGQWLAEIGHSSFPSSGRQRASALIRTKNR
jgi:hypothetical protein